MITRTSTQAGETPGTRTANATATAAMGTALNPRPAASPGGLRLGGHQSVPATANRPPRSAGPQWAARRCLMGTPRARASRSRSTARRMGTPPMARRMGTPPMVPQATRTDRRTSPRHRVVCRSALAGVSGEPRCAPYRPAPLLLLRAVAVRVATGHEAAVRVAARRSLVPPGAEVRAGLAVRAGLVDPARVDQVARVARVDPVVRGVRSVASVAGSAATAGELVPTASRPGRCAPRWPADATSSSPRSLCSS
jgi:hypothetical protein